MNNEKKFKLDDLLSIITYYGVVSIIGSIILGLLASEGIMGAVLIFIMLSSISGSIISITAISYSVIKLLDKWIIILSIKSWSCEVRMDIFKNIQ